MRQWLLEKLFSLWSGGDSRLVVVRVPNRPPTAPAIADARAVSVLPLGSTPASIADSIDGARSLMGTEHLTLAPRGELILACCSCGHAHRLGYELAIDAEQRLVLDMRIGTDAAVTDELRSNFTFPFKPAITWPKKAAYQGGSVCLHS